MFVSIDPGAFLFRIATPKQKNQTLFLIRQYFDHGIGEFIEARGIIGSISQVAPQSNAEKAGFKAGDSIIAVNNKPVKFFDEFQAEVQANR